MSAIIHLRAYTNSASVPTLVLVDLQQEYLAAPRALAIPDAATAVVNCQNALGHARSMGFPIAFTRWIGRSPFFNPATRFYQWIEGFEPTNVDLIFEREHPSCYASRLFADVISQGGGNFVFAGFAGESACLSTAVDAFHRGHRFTYLADASASHSFNDVTAADVHQVVQNIVGIYGDVTTTKAWIEHASRMNPKREATPWNR